MTMANLVIKILDLIIFPFKYYGLFVIMGSFLVLSYLFMTINKLIHS